MKKIRMGLLGCGGMGKSHQAGMAELSDLMQITVVCDIVPELARQAGENLGAEHVVTDYREMVDHLDAVLISLPHDLHHETGMFFLEHGKHVLMEKPMCNTEQECLDLINKAEAQKLTLMTAYPVRYWPIIQYMKQLVDNKTYGEAFQMSIWTEQLTMLDGKSWGRSAKRLGGGQFFSHGCHYVDLLLWFLGKPVRGMHMGTNLGTPWMEKEGTSNAVMEFENGVMGYHFGTWGARGTRLGYSFHIHCTEGMLEYNRKEGKLFLHTNIAREKANMDTSSSCVVLMEEDNSSKKTQYETRHFLECIQNGTRPMTDGPSSLQGLRVIWRLYQAEEENRIASLSGLGLDDDWSDATI
ncbi:MAG: Gfo/Idh/MocA family oxidoreductase [Ruminococcaceae bacterium]|nr:Gfo/Idh/MocA family oxidoreductase [Oscillospiraceae bacterium]